jgi:hypothetical protein
MSGYNIYQSDGTPVSIPANAIDTTLYNPTGGGGLGGSGTPAGIQFIGQNAVDYGAPIAQNFLQLTENFCSNVVPGNAFALQGQLWFNQAGATSGTLFVRATVNGSSSPVTAPAAVGSSPQAGWYQIVTDDGDGDVTITGTMTAGSFSGTLSGTASALAGGTAGQVPYQSAPGVTLFAGPGTSGQVLVSNGISGPSFEDTSTFLSLYLPLAGGTMTGNLILNGAPTTNLQAATKQYVDDNISGLQWQPAISAVDLINDSLSTPPGSPVTGQTYIINTAPTGAWTAIGAGHAVIWNGSAWIDLFGVVVPVGTWFGINLEHGGTPGGSFTGYSNALVYVTGNTPGSFTYTFNTPSTSSWAVTDTNDSDPVDFGDSYNWNTTSLAWVQFNTGVNYTAGTGISISAGKISNTGVTSLAAGSGVHISASTGAVTVSNSGVVSFNGRSGSVSLTSGDVATAQGLTAGGVFVGNGTNTGTNIGAGSAGFVLTSNGASTPSWPAVSGTARVECILELLTTQILMLLLGVLTLVEQLV